MQANESVWTARVCKAVSCWSWKIHTTTRRGIPDAIFIGPNGPLWAEFKFLRGDIPNLIRLDKHLTALQAKTLQNLHSIGQRTWVIIRHASGFYIGKGLNWTKNPVIDTQTTPSLTLEELVEAIHHEVGLCTPSGSSSSSSPSCSSSAG
jgi:hypothetical protein